MWSVAFSLMRGKHYVNENQKRGWALPFTGAFFVRCPPATLLHILELSATLTRLERNLPNVMQTQQDQGWRNTWTTSFSLPARERTATIEILETDVSWKLLLSLDKSVYPLEVTGWLMMLFLLFFFKETFLHLECKKNESSGHRYDNGLKDREAWPRCSQMSGRVKLSLSCYRNTHTEGLTKLLRRYLG